VALVVALLMGIRHATDPDHLTAVSTLALSEKDAGRRRAAVLGLSWGAAHATTLMAFGLPLVLFGSHLPDGVERAAELAVGLVMVGLAGRLLVRWRRGYLHIHPHSHGELRHAHPHMHEHRPEEGHPESHEHSHPEALGRSPAAAYGIGLLHGVGGSAGAGVLLIGAMHGEAGAAIALGVFAAGTALSMALASTGVALAVGAGRAARRAATLVPALGALGVAFGAWYSVTAIEYA
jgi:ABC-type nickel/cobalt efflux system permease component RcnA